MPTAVGWTPMAVTRAERRVTIIVIAHRRVPSSQSRPGIEPFRIVLRLARLVQPLFMQASQAMAGISTVTAMGSVASDRLGTLGLRCHSGTHAW